MSTDLFNTRQIGKFTQKSLIVIASNLEFILIVVSNYYDIMINKVITCCHVVSPRILDSFT